jgi:acylphosphatase
MICVHVRVSGRVQGVFYRAFTQNKAREMGIKGWVKNVPGGGVEAVLEGGSMVLGMELSELKCKGYDDFEVIR